MRSTRAHNVDHDNRRNDYRINNHSNRGQSHAESNGHGNNTANNEYRSSKRSSVSSSSGNLIKRMKSSSSSSQAENSTRENVNSNLQKSNNSSSSNFVNIDQNECHQLTYNGYAHEETEALTETNLLRKSTIDFEKFTEVTSNLKKLIIKIGEHKKEKCQQKQNNNNNTNKIDDTLSDIKVTGLMYLMEMKYLNRMEKHRLKEARKRISQDKDKVDQIHLQLQNIQYEVMHLQKEQKTCASFRSKDENLDLVEEEKFLISDHFPEDLKYLLIRTSSDSTVSLNKTEATSEELHKLHLARLDWELKQRISSDNKLKMADESRYRLELEISTKKRTLSQFDPTLKNVIDAARPLASQLNVPLKVYNTSNMLTSFLPQPLYVLYIQLCAYKSAFELSYEVNITGSAEEAQEFELKQKNEINNIYFLMSKNDDNDDDNGHGQMDDDDEEMERRSKPKKSRYHTHHKSSDLEPVQENIHSIPDNIKSTDKNDFVQNYSKLLQNHPMKINLIFHYRHYQLSCTFKFFPKLEMIGLDYKIENLNSDLTKSDFLVTNYENNIFSKLLSSSDTGYKCPNATIEHLLRGYGIVTYSDLVAEIGYTYDWAQRIAGIEYLNPDEKPLLSNRGIIRVKSSIASDCLDKTIQMMILRFKSRINLQEQLEEIGDKKCVDINKFQSLLNSKEVLDKQVLIESKPKSTIVSFEKINSDEFINGLSGHEKKNLIDYFERQDGEDFSNDLFDQNNFIFKMLIKNGIEHEEDNVDVFIIIPHNYPWRWPFFICSGCRKNFLFHSWVRSLEEHINVNLPLKVIKQAKSIDECLYSETLLLRQIYDLQCGLDAIRETLEKYGRKSNNESLEIYSGPRSVNSFQSISIVQGHDHSLKFA